MKKWSKIFGQAMLVLAYFLQFCSMDPKLAINPNRWLWGLHNRVFPVAGLKVTPIGSIPGFAY